MTKRDAEAAVHKYGSGNEAARRLGVARSTVQKALKRGDGEGKRTIPIIKTPGRTLADFRQTYDKSTIVPAKVKAAIKALGAGGWEYEVQFAKIAGVSLADLGIFRDQFAAFVVSLREGRRAWAGSAATAKTMREML